MTATRLQVRKLRTKFRVLGDQQREKDRHTYLGLSPGCSVNRKNIRTITVHEYGLGRIPSRSIVRQISKPVPLVVIAKCLIQH